MTAPRWSLGSRWLRWEPHLHAPGTLRNDQFRGDWDGYIRRIEAAQPAPVALGITECVGATARSAWSPSCSRCLFERKLSLKNVAAPLRQFHGTVADDGAVVVSDALEAHARAALGLDQPLRVRGLTDGHCGYLLWHRARVFNARPVVHS